MNFGILGLIFIVISWIPEIRRTIISKDIKGLDIKFVVLYFLGSAILFIHAINIKDVVFIILNGLLSLMALAQFFILIKRNEK